MEEEQNKIEKKVRLQKHLLERYPNLSALINDWEKTMTIHTYQKVFVGLVKRLPEVYKLQQEEKKFLIGKVGCKDIVVLVKQASWIWEDSSIKIKLMPVLVPIYKNFCLYCKNLSLRSNTLTYLRTAIESHGSAAAQVSDFSYVLKLVKEVENTERRLDEKRAAYYVSPKQNLNNYCVTS